MDAIVSFIFYPESNLWVLLLKLVFILVSFIFLVGSVWLFFNTTWGKRFILEDLTETASARPFGAKKSFKEWIAIRKKIDSKKEEDCKSAIVQADDLLGDILLKLKYEGTNTSERLEKVDASTIPDIKELILVHKIRNNIVFNPDFKVDYNTAKKALEAYEKALRNLEIF